MSNAQVALATITGLIALFSFSFAVFWKIIQDVKAGLILQLGNLDDKVEKRHEENKNIAKDNIFELKEIKGALIGTINKLGILSRLEGQEEKMVRIEEQINILCKGCKYYKDDIK